LKKNESPWGSIHAKPDFPVPNDDRPAASTFAAGRSPWRKIFRHFSKSYLLLIRPTPKLPFIMTHHSNTHYHCLASPTVFIWTKLLPLFSAKVEKWVLKNQLITRAGALP
jgi:hypothetical protein